MPADADSTLTVILKPSRRLAVLLAAAHAAAAAAAAAVATPLPLAFVLGGLLVANGALVIWRVALRRASTAVVALRIRRPDSLSFSTRDGAWREGRVLGTSFVAPHLVVLNIETAGSGRTVHVVMTPDSVDPEACRRLRVWLIWGLKTASRHA